MTPSRLLSRSSYGSTSSPLVRRVGPPAAPKRCPARLTESSVREHSQDPIFYPGTPLFPDITDSEDADSDIISLKSFEFGGRKQRAGRAKPRPCAIILIRPQTVVDKEGIQHECFRLWLAGLFEFDGDTDAVDSLVLLDANHRGTRMGEWLYPTTRTSQNPPLPDEWRSKFHNRPGITIEESTSCAVYEPPCHTWVYGDIQSFVVPKSDLQVRRYVKMVSSLFFSLTR